MARIRIFIYVFLFCVHFILALHLIAERLASVLVDTSFKVFGVTQLRIEPSLPASKANALNHLDLRGKTCEVLEENKSREQ